MSNKFNLLKDKSIIEILDGDTELGTHNLSDGSSMVLKMPYLSGPDLCGLSTRFGLPVTYPYCGGSALSRWQYLCNLIDHCIKKDTCSQLLSYIFKKESFYNLLCGKFSDDIDVCYKLIVKSAINRINGFLYFSGNELVQTGNNFLIKSIGKNLIVDTPSIKFIDREYIKSISLRAISDIEIGNYDSAITKARTLLEEVFCYVIEEKNNTPDSSGNIQKLYKQVRELYNMHTDKNIDKRINILLSGLSHIVTAIAEMRNINSDSHGVGSKRISIDSHHALLFVNSSISMAEFILSVQSKH